ncbi:hypothetical protein B0T17DRAFT_509208 [Bombardia bombarda]|uniref:Uncharacterized protein n=1 Tax=Bombardia bombarda TaxID=252184 RepID=A0AA40C1V9_9PEZI|nr:hypothetical protein B0T17DRAFT_509208 [Bombardia bombarda]
MGIPGGEINPGQAVDGLVRAMRDLTADPNYKLVADVFSQFLFLKDRNDTLTVSHREVLEQYRTFRNELEGQKERLEQDKRDLEGAIRDKIQEIIQLSAAKTSLEGDLGDTTASLEHEKKSAAAAAETAAKELANLQADKDAVVAEKQSVEKAAAAAATVAAGEIAALVGIKTDLEAWKMRAEIDAEQAAQDIAGLQSDKAGLEEVKANNEAEIATLKGTIATLEEQKKSVEDALQAANAEIASLKETIATKNNEIVSLQESLRAAEEQIASLQQTIEDKNGEIEDLHTKLKAEGERADTAIAHGNGLQIKLDDTEQNLHITSGKLADLEQYRIVLNTEEEDTYVTVLDKIWTTIVTLVESTFRPDIDYAILSDPSCWTNLRNSPYLKHATQLQIPLPPSNSSAAKGMRISAVLAVLSRALYRHVFRPVYLLDGDDAADDALVKFLRVLEDDDPTREAHLRATLLCMLPERQAEQGARRVKTVVREVSWLVQHLLSALQFEAFCVGLEGACRLACEQWMRIQTAQMKVEPYFGPPYDDFDWQVLDLPEFTEAAGGGHHSLMMGGGGGGGGGESAVDDGDEVAVGDDDGPLETVEATDMAASGSVVDGADGGFQDEEGSGTGTITGLDDEVDEGEGEIDPDEILLVVWPSMCSVENGDLMSITQGLVISKEQARPALEEVRSRSRIIPRPGSRRARTLSMPGVSRGSSPRGKAASFLAAATSHAQLAASPDPAGAGGVADGGQDDG